MPKCPHCNKVLDIETQNECKVPVLFAENGDSMIKRDIQDTLAEIGKLLGLRVGDSIHDALPKLEQFIASRDEIATVANDSLKHLDTLSRKIDPLTLEAVAKVRGPREKEYGDKLTNFTDIANIENAAHALTALRHGKESIRSAESVAIDNICQKLARLRKSPDHYDTLVDLVGYVLCYRDIRRARNPELYEKEEARFSAEKS